MAIEQLKCGNHFGQYNYKAHLYTNNNDPLEREKIHDEGKRWVLEKSREGIQSTSGGIDKQ